MPVKTTCVITLCLAVGFSTPAQAGLGDLLQKIGDSGQELLKQPTGEVSGALSTDTIAQGLKEALAIGTEKAVSLTGRTDGYWGNPDIRIPLPPQIDKAGALLRNLGLGSTVDEFELSMNRAAEQAAPEAMTYFKQALQEMSIDDARQILNGPDNAATEYFRNKTFEPLTQRFMPIIQAQMDQVGVTSLYRQLSGEVEKLPMMGGLNLNLEQHVTQQALDGLFQMLAAEELRIRTEPVARTTDLLKQVFSR